METLKTALQNKKAKLLASGSVVAISLGASAAHADATAAINSALTEGAALVALVAPGIIGIAALMLGVGLVVSWLRK